MKRTLKSTALGLLSAAVAATCVASAPALAQSTNPDLVLSKTWMKLILPSRPAAGYFTLENKGGKAVDLVKAASPGCGTLMLHKTVSDNGEMKMVMVEKIGVKAGGSLTFKPGGFHLMCMQPTEAVRPGKSVPVTLTFDDGSSITQDFPVTDAKGGK